MQTDLLLKLYYLQYGSLKVLKSSPDGREQSVLRFLDADEIFNEVGVFAKRAEGDVIERRGWTNQTELPAHLGAVSILAGQVHDFPYSSDVGETGKVLLVDDNNHQTRRLGRGIAR